MEVEYISLRETEDKLRALYKKERKRLNAIKSGLTGEYDKPVFGEGAADAHIMLVGEAPGAKEAKSSKPFVAAAGKELDIILGEASIKRDEIFITNSLKFRPITKTDRGMRNRAPAKAELLDALICLKGEIDIIKPRLIVTLGNSPLWSLCSIFKLTPMNIGMVHGKGISAEYEGRRITLYPMYHPASVIYNPSLKQAQKDDAQALARLIHLITGDNT